MRYWYLKRQQNKFLKKANRLMTKIQTYQQYIERISIYRLAELKADLAELMFDKEELETKLRRYE